MVESEMGFDAFWMDNCVLVFPLGGSECCGEGLIKHFSLETTGGCESVFSEVHVGCHGLGSRVSSQFQAVGEICSKLIVNIDDELTFSLVLDALEADPAAALAGRTILSSMDHIC